MASKINADEFVDREGEGKPTLPKGVVLSGVTTITTAVVAENEVANSTGINAGIITSTHFAGNLTGDVNAGIVTVTSQTVVGSAVTISASGIDIGAGVITATSYAGSGANLTGIGATIMVWEYNPDPSDTVVTLDTGIGITFNQKIKAGSGNITLREDSASGTVVENFGIGSSVTIAGNSLSLTPTSDLGENKIYHLSYPSGVITNMAGDSYVGTAYTFKSLAYDYKLWSWGLNSAGQLGLNEGASDPDKSSPVQVPGTNWKTIGSNEEGTKRSISAVTAAGELFVWGENEGGVLGDNSTIDKSSPIQIPGNWGYAMIGGASIGVKADGTLWSWGDDTNGMGGRNTDGVRVSSPTQIGSSADWASGRGKISTGAAIKTDGTLWMWGSNSSGQSGQNNRTVYSSPIQVPGTTWNNIDVGYYGWAVATKTDGTGWSWGHNRLGTLGLNQGGEPGPHRSSPTQLPGTTWAAINAGYLNNTAVKTDGTLWGWGQNNAGQIGNNNRTTCSSPVQVPGTTWSSNPYNIATGADGATSIAIRTDGTLWVWGQGEKGQMANNAVTSRSSPIQVGSGTDWYQVQSTGGRGLYAITKST